MQEIVVTVIDETINTQTFLERLQASEPEAWDRLLNYVRHRVATLLPRFVSSPDQRRELHEDYCSEACTAILQNLPSFRGEGPLAAFLDAIIRQVVLSTGPRKHCLRAMNRFLKSVNQYLSDDHRRRLLAIINELPDGEMLIAYMSDQPLHLADVARQRRWSRVRIELLKHEQFQYLLTEQQAHISQANTLLSHFESWQHSGQSLDRIPADVLAQDDDSLQHDLRYTHLNDCLEALHQRTRQQTRTDYYQAIILKYFEEMPDIDIAAALHITPTLVRKWLERAKAILRTCLEEKSA
jgi:RNA polymerase sigma factor (sigma-70 family)